MIKYFLQNKKRFITYLLLSPAMSITSVLFASALEPLVNSATQKDVAVMLRATVIFALIVVADLATSFFHKISRENLRKEFLISLKNDLFAGIMNKSFQEYRKEPPSYYVSMMQRDVKKVSTDYFDSFHKLYGYCAGPDQGYSFDLPYQRCDRTFFSFYS